MPPVENPQAEVRLGLVLYGGVSLAIYMYGVARELLRLVRASQDTGANPYGDLLTEARVKVIVDVISGTSAGGINGVLLAKALAGGADIAPARKLWLEAGDFDELLQPTSDPAPPSLLRSKVMRDKLAEAFREMDAQRDKAPPADVLDLFVTGTHLEGRVVRFRDLLNHEVDTLDHRHTFHLKHRSTFSRFGVEQGWDHSDFAANEWLVQMARTTSAFPAAFQPELIRDEFLLVHRQPPAWFSDGGILQNRPFTQTISTIFNRTGDLPVRRCLVSVDPDPEQFGDPPEDPEEPTWLNVVRGATSKIPRYQSIATDLERLRERNRRVTEMHELLGHVEASVHPALREQLAAEDPFAYREFLSRQVLYEPWLRMRHEDTVERIATVAGAGVEEELGVLAGPALEQVDTGFELRRIYYLLAALPALYGERAEELRLARALLWTEFENVRDAEWRAWQGRDVAAAAEHLSGELAEIGARVRRACVAIQDGLPSPIADPVFRQPLPEVFDSYEFRDMLILPLQRLGDLGERDRIDFVRISPGAADYIGKDARDKVAGDTLGHFGGFLSSEWRENDILWGRLDAAEVLVKVVLADADQATRERHIRALQEGIVEDELKIRPDDYRRYMREEHRVGEQTVNSLPPNRLARLGLDAGAVFRNMIRTLERAEAPTGGGKTRATAFRYAGRGLGALLAFVHWPATALFGEGAAKRFAAGLLVGAFLWGLTNLLLDVLGVVELSDELTLISAAALVPYLIFLLGWLLLRRALRKRP